jgi:hypothetical protein
MTEGGSSLGVWPKKKDALLLLRAGLEEEMAISGNGLRWCGADWGQSVSFDCSAITSLLARYSSEKRETDSRPA